MSITFDKVDYIYGKGTSFEKRALKDISFHIRDGEFVGIIGHTGSGKSTLIQHMNGLLKCTGGNVYYDCKDISNREYDRKTLRQNVGIVFQYPEHQLFEATVGKDVAFGPNNLNIPGLQADVRTYEALKSVGIDDSLLDVSPFDLSGGQKRRVAIAGVLAMKPKVLVLDEPAAGLDPVGRRDILDMIARIRREENITVILVSHSMEDVAEYVDRIMVMNDGALEMDGTVSEVFARRKELEEMGLSVPQISLLMGDLEDAGIIKDTGIYTMEEAVRVLSQKLLDRRGRNQ
ncbi:MAG: energy-coupling factor transporter ATPase [Lachnospiraceae bacterium]|nr:energy-coupling factor transporter ATPase [Lachnospiraceae bacterium]